MNTVKIASLAQTLGKTPPESFRVLPAGRFRAADGSGRPLDVPEGWLLTAEVAARVIAHAAARQSQTLIDYEHQSLAAAKNGHPVPAAGWFSALEWREDGLYVTGARWTGRAAGMIASEEYRYISPVFSYDPASGAILRLISVGLTNTPGLDGLTDLAALTAEESNMDELLERLRYMLNLPLTATAEDMVAELGKLAEQLKTKTGSDALAAMIAKIDEQNTALAQLKTQLEDGKKGTVPMSEHARLQEQLTALHARVEASERAELMAAGLADGRILPAQKEYWENQPLDALKSWLSVAQPIAALNGTQTGGTAPDGKGKAALTAEDQYVMGQLGLSEDEYLKHKDKE